MVILLWGPWRIKPVRSHVKTPASFSAVSCTLNKGFAALSQVEHKFLRSVQTSSLWVPDSSPPEILCALLWAEVVKECEWSITRVACLRQNQLQSVTNPQGQRAKTSEDHMGLWFNLGKLRLSFNLAELWQNCLSSCLWMGWCMKSVGLSCPEKNELIKILIATRRNQNIWCGRKTGERLSVSRTQSCGAWSCLDKPSTSVCGWKWNGKLDHEWYIYSFEDIQGSGEGSIEKAGRKKELRNNMRDEVQSKQTKKQVLLKTWWTPCRKTWIITENLWMTLSNLRNFSGK